MADVWSGLRVRPMTVDEATRVASWRYAGQWSVYDLTSARPLVDDLASYYAVVAGETLIGFCCIGAAARVGGMTEDPAVVDVGMGMDPALVGHGHGAAFGQTVLDHLAETCPGRPAPSSRRNQHSLRTTSRFGFEEVGELTTMQDGRPVAYRIVVKGTGQVPV
jgi:GNAT superfamily N-acetyltransferase